MNVKAYTIIRSDKNEADLEDSVQDMIAEGWQPLGPPVINEGGNDDPWWSGYQAMVTGKEQ